MDHNRASYRQQRNRARPPIEDLVLTTARSSPTFVTACCICLDMADRKRTLYWSRTCILFVCAFIHVLHGRLYYVSILGDTFVDKQLVPVFSGCVGCLSIQHHTTFCRFPFLYHRLSLCRIMFKYVVLGGDVLKGWTV